MAFLQKKNLLTILLMVLFLNGFSQKGKRERPKIGVLSGEIIDNRTGEKLEYVTVALFSLRTKNLVTGGISDKNGRFKIKEIPLGKYDIKFNFISYQEKIIKNVAFSPKGKIKNNLGIIKLEINDLELEGIEVVSEKSMMVNTIDKKVFNVSQNFTSDGGSATEIMQNIPSVDVDIDGNVSLRGSENVTILIDGKPSGLDATTLLEQIPASSIESVEVITTPSAKFDPDGMAGIINVVLKKNKLKGMNASITTGINSDKGMNASAQLNFRKEKFNLYTNYAFRNDKRSMNGTTYRENYLTNDATIILDQRLKKSNDISSNLIKFGGEYYLNDKNTFSMDFSHNQGGMYRIEDLEYRTLDGSNILTDLYFRDNTEDSDRQSSNINILYQKKFDKQKHVLDFSYSYNYSLREEDGDYAEQDYNLDYTPNNDVVPYLENNFSNNETKISSFQLDYVFPIDELSKLELGYKTILKNLNNNFEAESFDYSQSLFLNDENKTNEFEYEQENHSVYGIYGRAMGNFGFQIGSRLEQTNTNSKLINTNEKHNNDYFSIFPSAHINYDLTEVQQFQLSYSRRINRPSTRVLNPFTDYNDPSNLRKGNPSLNPEYIDSYEMSYANRLDKFSFTTALYYRKTTDKISYFKIVEEDENGNITSTTTYKNFAKEQSIGLELVGTLRPFNWLNLTSSSNFYRSKIDGSNISDDLANDAIAFSSKLMSTIKMPKSFSVQISGRYRSPRVFAQGKMFAFYMMDIAVKKKLWKDKANITLRLSDVFDTFKFSYELSDFNYMQKNVRNRSSRILSIAFTYRFGKNEYKKKKKKISNNNNNDAFEME